MLKKSNFPIIISEDIQYELPMMPEHTPLWDYSEDIVKANILNDGKGYIKVYKEGYKDKWFVDIYFQYLIDVGYIKKCNNGGKNEKSI